MAIPNDAVASMSLPTLDALSPDAATRRPNGPDDLGAPDIVATSTADSEPIPTLATLLLSTAESLASRSTGSTSSSSATAPIRSAAGKQATKPGFTLSTSPQALLNHPAAPAYLSSLLGQPLSELQSLPTALSNLSTSLDNDLSSLAFTRYSSFLLSYTAAQSISTSFSTLSDSLTALLDSTSALEAAAASFETRVHTVRQKRERVARVRERVEEVEELLEAPAVVDACVRAGHWSEAIDVAVRLEDLHKRLARSASAAGSRGEGAGALRLVDRVRGEVGHALLSLRARVLESLLHRTLKLPGAVRGIGILRRIAEREAGAANGVEPITKALGKRKELDEDSLRVVFLVARWRCLRNELESVEAQLAASGIQLVGPEPPLAQQDADVSVEGNDERMRWTKRWIEVWREIVGDTVGIFAEVFLASSSLHTGAKAAEQPIDLDIPSHALSPAAPLHLFLSTALNSLTNVLARAIIGLNSTASLSSLLTQLTYCSHSFARFGLDFRDWIQLRERIELRIGRIVAAEWETAGRKWEREWRDGWENSGGAATTAARARRAGRVPLSDWLVAPEGVTSLLSTPTPQAVPARTRARDWHHQPSPSLALLPPVARFLNAHATALNALRLLPPVSLYLPLRRAQAVEVDRATQVLAAFTEAWLAALNATPLPPQDGFSGSDGSAPNTLSEDERTIMAEREAERRVVACAIAWFGRVVVPWCEGALDQGVYAELETKGRRPVEARGREGGVMDAIRRCEVLLARIEGRDLEEPTEDGKDEAVATDRAELPVLDASAAASPLPAVKPSDEPTSLEATVLSNGSAKLVDFTVPDILEVPLASVDGDNTTTAVDDGAAPDNVVDSTGSPARIHASEAAEFSEKASPATKVGQSNGVSADPAGL